MSKIPKPTFLKKPTESLPGNARLPLTDLMNVPMEMDYHGKRVASPELVNAALLNRTKLRRSRSATDLSRPNFHRAKFVPNLETIAAAKKDLLATAIPAVPKFNSHHAQVRELQRPGTLRKSLSTSDLRMKPGPSGSISNNSSTQFKRQLSTVTTATTVIPTKATKIAGGTSATGKVFGTTAKPAAAAAAAMRKPLAPSAIGKSKVQGGLAAGRNVLANSSVSSNKSSVSSGGAGKKAAVKRIPPYDYKARFNDLLEKHQVLKDKLENLRQINSDLESLPQKYDDCLNELNKLKREHRQLQEDHRTASMENDDLKLKNVSLSSNLKETEAELQSLKRQYTEADSERRQLRELLKTLQETTAQQEQRIAFLQEDNEKKGEMLFKANLERKDLHNAVMDLRGNIRVFCRVRPPLPSEEDRLECAWKYLDESSLEIGATDGSNKRMEFSFDHVFHSRTPQEDIFENVAPLIQSALDGYNVCIFAYGQTGSGKTYTMDGVPTSLGVIPRTVDLIFDSVEQYKRLGWEYEVGSFLNNLF